MLDTSAFKEMRAGQSTVTGRHLTDAYRASVDVIDLEA